MKQCWKPGQRTRVALTVTVQAWAERFELSPAEKDVLLLAVTSPKRGHDEIARRRRVLRDTIKSQSSDLCKKTGSESLQVAVTRVLQETLERAFRQRLV